MRELVIGYKLSFTLDDEIRDAMRLNAFHCFPPLMERHPGSPSTPGAPIKHRRVIVTVHPRLIDWSRVTLDAARKMWFFCIMNAVTHSFTAQTEGVLLQNSMEGFGVKNVCLAFQKFLASAMVKCIPCRISAGFIGNQPFVFGTMLWPLMKTILAKKIRDRMHILGTDFKPLHAELQDDDMILQELGGRLVVTDETSAAAQIEYMEEQHAKAFGLKRARAFAK